MFNYFKKSFLIIFFLGISSSVYGMGTTTFASILSPFSYLYNKLSQYNYTLQSAFSRILETGNFTQENLQAIQKYLEKGYSTNITIGKNEKTPLVLAVEHQNLDIIKLLLQYNADINACDSYGNTPLSTAIKTGNLQVAEYLLQHKADQSAENDNFPLTVAVEHQNLDMIKLLLQYKADINTSDTSGNTPLSAAAMTGNCQIAEYLLKIDANPNPEGKTPLIVAIEHQNLDMVKLLLQYNADINYCNIYGDTPLSIAIETDNLEAIKILCNARASLILDNGTTIFDLLLGKPKIYFTTVMTYIRFDDLPRVALETLLILKKQYPETYKDLHDLTLSKLLTSNNIDNLDDFKKKMGQELSIMSTYKDPLLAQVYKRITQLQEILQMQNNKNQTALQMLYVNFWDEREYVNEIVLLLDAAILDNDFNKLEAALKDINSESKTKLTATELISALDSKLDQNNLALQMYKNCALLN